MSERLANVQVTAPVLCAGNVLGELNAIGGWIDGHSVTAESITLEARVPVSTIDTFKQWLADASEGRGSCVVLGNGTAEDA